MCGVPPDFAEFGGMGWEGAELELLISPFIPPIVWPSLVLKVAQASRQRTRWLMVRR